MIKISKSNNTPQTLLDKGIAGKIRLCQEYNLAPLDYTSRQNISNKKLKKLVIDNSIYGDTTVKEQLITDQNEKCCFCEAKFTATSYGDVEHFRPKKAYKKDRKLIYPGYYWLSYDWNNLLFSCEKCNRSFKKNEFPLLDDETRVNNHNEAHNLSDEKHTLINPIAENPEHFIKFNQHIPVAIDNNERGTTSIKTFGLDRAELNNDRLEYLNGLKIFKKISDIDDNNEERIIHAMATFEMSRTEIIEFIKTAKNLYENAAKKENRFTNMVRSNFLDLIKN